MFLGAKRRTPTPQSQLANLFKMSDIALLPSLQEPQRMIMLESIPSGCITVSSRVGGIPESISHGEPGFLIENPHDAGEALYLVEHVLDNPKNLDTLRATARKQITENFSWDKLAMRLKNIYSMSPPDIRSLLAPRIRNKIIPVGNRQFAQIGLAKTALL